MPTTIVTNLKTVNWRWANPGMTTNLLGSLWGIHLTGLPMAADFGFRLSRAQVIQLTPTYASGLLTYEIVLSRSAAIFAWLELDGSQISKIERAPANIRHTLSFAVGQSTLERSVELNLEISNP